MSDQLNSSNEESSRRVTRSRVKADEPPATPLDNDAISAGRRKRVSVDRDIISNPALLNSPRRTRRLSTDDHESRAGTPPVRALRSRRISTDRESATGTPTILIDDSDTDTKPAGLRRSRRVSTDREIINTPKRTTTLAPVSESPDLEEETVVTKKIRSYNFIDKIPLARHSISSGSDDAAMKTSGDLNRSMDRNFKQTVIPSPAKGEIEEKSANVSVNEAEVSVNDAEPVPDQLESLSKTLKSPGKALKSPRKSLNNTHLDEAKDNSDDKLSIGSLSVEECCEDDKSTPIKAPKFTFRKEVPPSRHSIHVPKANGLSPVKGSPNLNRTLDRNFKSSVTKNSSIEKEQIEADEEEPIEVDEEEQSNDKQLYDKKSRQILERSIIEQIQSDIAAQSDESDDDMDSSNNSNDVVEKKEETKKSQPSPNKEVDDKIDEVDEAKEADDGEDDEADEASDTDDDDEEDDDNETEDDEAAEADESDDDEINNSKDESFGAVKKGSTNKITGTSSGEVSPNKVSHILDRCQNFLVTRTMEKAEGRVVDEEKRQKKKERKELKKKQKAEELKRKEEILAKQKAQKEHMELKNREKDQQVKPAKIRAEVPKKEDKISAKPKVSTKTVDQEKQHVLKKLDKLLSSNVQADKRKAGGREQENNPPKKKLKILDAANTFQISDKLKKPAKANKNTEDDDYVAKKKPEMIPDKKFHQLAKLQRKEQQKLKDAVKKKSGKSMKHVKEPLRVLPKPVWTSSGLFQVEEVGSPIKSKTAKKQGFNVEMISATNNPSQKNFREEFQNRKDIRRVESHTLLKRRKFY